MFTVRRFNDGTDAGTDAGAGSKGGGDGAGGTQDTAAASKLAALNARIAARRKQNEQQQQQQQQQGQQAGQAGAAAATAAAAAAGTPGTAGTAAPAPAIHPSRLAIAPALRTKDPSRPKTKAKQRYLKAKKDRRKSRLKARPKGDKAAKATADDGASATGPITTSAEEETAIAVAWGQRRQAAKQQPQQGEEEDAESSSGDSDSDSDSDDNTDEDDEDEDISIRADALQPGLPSAFPEETDAGHDKQGPTALQRFPAPRSTLLPASSAILRAQGLPSGLSAPTVVSPALRASLGGAPPKKAVRQENEEEDDEDAEEEAEADDVGREKKRRKKDSGGVEAVAASLQVEDVVTPLISEGMRNRLQELGIKEWFAVQTSVIPLLLPNPRPLSPFYPIATPSHTPRDLLVAAPTGSGKTLAYIVPLLEWLGRRPHPPPAPSSSSSRLEHKDPILAEFTRHAGPLTRQLRALIVLPTRDLVSQVGETVQLLAKGLDVRVGLAGVTGGGGGGGGGSFFAGGQEGGGVSGSGPSGGASSATFAQEQERLVDLPPLRERERGAIFARDSAHWWAPLLDPVRNSRSTPPPRSKIDILITTPGRLVDHLAYTPGFTLEHLRWLVLDEADRLLAQSFGGWREKVWEALRPKATATAAAATASDGEDRAGGSSCRAPAWLRAEQIARNPGAPVTLAGDERPELANASQVQKVLFSATLTRDPGMLEMLELRRPLFVTVRDSKKQEGAGDVGEEVQDGKIDDGSYALPEQLKEHVLVTKDIPKPVALLHLLLSARFDMLGLHSAPVGLASAAPSQSDGQTAARKKRKSSASATLAQDADDESGGKGVLVFTKSIEAARRLVRLVELFREEDGAREVKRLVVRHYSSEMRPAERRKVLRSFAAGEVNVLVASDLIARGIDLPSVAHVISYDVPVDMGKYVHRVGRTARAGRRGDAWALVEEHEARHFRKMVEGSRGKRRSRREMERVKVERAEWGGLEGAYRAALERLGAEFGQ